MNELYILVSPKKLIKIESDRFAFPGDRINRIHEFDMWSYSDNSTLLNRILSIHMN